MAIIVIYSTLHCSYCQRARQLLTEKGVDFDEIRVDLQPERRSEMEQRSGRQSVPQIFIGEQHIGGCDDLYALDASGKLDVLLQG